MIEIDWKAEAVKELRNYKFNVQGVKNLRERIEILDAQLEGIRSPGSTEGAESGRERRDLLRRYHQAGQYAQEA